ncbi:MAG: hypothetical protein AAF441_27535 [Pseudomonadota bacterium]
MRIAEVHVAAGQFVEKGEPIYTLEDAGGRRGIMRAPMPGMVEEGPVDEGAAFSEAVPVIGLELAPEPAPDVTDYPYPEAPVEPPHAAPEKRGIWRVEELDPRPAAAFAAPEAPDPPQEEVRPAASMDSGFREQSNHWSERAEQQAAPEEPKNEPAPESKGSFFTFLCGLFLTAFLAGALGLAMQATITLPADYARWPSIALMLFIFTAWVCVLAITISRFEEFVGMFVGGILFIPFVLIFVALGPEGRRGIPALGESVHAVTGYDPADEIFAVAYAPNWVEAFQSGFCVQKLGLAACFCEPRRDA